MANQDRGLPKAPFPAPPPFWKHLTSENLIKLRAIEDASSNAEPPRILPLELQYLEPPSPPPDTYTSFGEEHSLSPTLGSLSDISLFPATSSSGAPTNNAFYLTKITKSLLLNFLELTTILSVNPSLSLPKLEDIKTLFWNAHHLINMYRPHQARETLILMLEDQLEAGKREIDECEEVKAKVESALREIGTNGNFQKQNIDAGDDRTDLMRNADDQVETKRLWHMIHELFDD